MIYLQDNPLLKQPLRPDHIKNRLLGHWGSSPGLSFIYVHLNRVIRKYDLDMIFLAGPGHGAPGVLGPAYLEGTYSEIYPDKSQDPDGLREFFRQFSFPGGIGSHCTPETPGSIHEGGELGYVLSHACGAAFDNPELIVAAVVGDGESETGPLATSWNGGVLKKPLRLPDFRDYACTVDNPAQSHTENTRPLGAFLAEVMKRNMGNFRVFGPDETTSNKLDAIYAVSKKFWIEEFFPEDRDGGELATDGRVMEMLSEHTMEGMLEGYLLTGRHGFLSTYESFVHVIDSMFNQHAKWLEICKHLSWRKAIASLNLLITSTVWRQDHNGFTHQDPGFLDVVVNKSANITRIYLPPDANCLLSVANHCLRSENYVNVIVCDKQNHLQYLNMDAAVIHCTKGVGIWEWASNDNGGEPDVVMASAGDVPTQEALAASVLLRKEFPDLKVRFINVVDLFKLQPNTEHPHGLSDHDFDSLFTIDKPVLFNFHGYPQLIHRLAYRRTNHANIHVRGYKEKGSINTPLELAIENNIDRFSLAMDVINRVPHLQRIGGHAKEKFLNQQIECRNYAHLHGIDKPDAANWIWPY
jgi:xylulose-5-phosphate/fructose-6-phosphate phosphoketolase